MKRKLWSWDECWSWRSLLSYSSIIVPQTPKSSGLTDVQTYANVRSYLVLSLHSSIFILLVCILVVGKMCAMWKISLAFNIHRHHLLTSIYTGPHLLTSIYIHRHIPVDLLYDGYFVEVEDEPWQVTHGEHRDDQHQHHWHPASKKSKL